VVNRALGGRLRLLRPFERLGKDEVLRRGTGLPLELTLSCLRPVGDRHCGACNKCAERRRGFRDAGRADLTAYATDPGPSRRIPTRPAEDGIPEWNDACIE
jgi:7-cyano-7-deazaguanine synthase